MQTAMEYVRFRSACAGAKGYKVGVFGLVNVLGKHGMLTPEEERFRRENNAWYDTAYPSPASCYQDHPAAVAWFKDTAAELLERIPGYLAILDAHRIAWEEARTSTPGLIVYEDACQVLAVTGHPVPGEIQTPNGPDFYYRDGALARCGAVTCRTQQDLKPAPH